MANIEDLILTNFSFNQVIEFFKSKADSNEGANIDFNFDQIGTFLSVYSDHGNLMQWIQSFKTILRNLYDSDLTLIPGSMRKINSLDESIYLFFKLCYFSPSFKQTFATFKNSLEINYMIIFYLVDIYNSQMRTGLFEILTALILELSSNKDYCVNLNQPVSESILITGIPIVSGSYIDLYFVAFCYIMIESDQHMGYFANFLAI